MQYLCLLMVTFLSYLELYGHSLKVNENKLNEAAI